MFEFTRVKYKAFTEKKWSKWISNLLVAIVMYASASAVIPLALSYKNSWISDWLVMAGLPQASFIQYGALVSALLTLLSPGVGVAIMTVIVVGGLLAVAPCLMSFVALAMFSAIAMNKAVKAMVILMPAAIIQLSAEQMAELGLSSPLLKLQLGFFVLAFIIYVSEKLDRISYSLTAPVSFVGLAVPCGLFGTINGMDYLINYWKKNKEDNLFRGNPDQYLLLSWKQILIILAVMLAVSVAFFILINMKKTAYAKLKVDIRDGIAFTVFAVLLIAAFPVIRSLTGLKTPELNVPALIIQILAAYLLSRPVAKCEYQEKNPLKKKELSEEEQAAERKRKKRVLIVFILIFAFVAGGAFYIYKNYTEEVKNIIGMANPKPHDMSGNEFCGRWVAMPWTDSSGCSYDGYDSYFVLNEDGTVNSSENGDGYWYQTEDGIVLIYEDWSDSFVYKEDYYLDTRDPLVWEDEYGNVHEEKYLRPYIRAD